MRGHPPFAEPMQPLLLCEQNQTNGYSYPRAAGEVSALSYQVNCGASWFVQNVYYQRLKNVTCARTTLPECVVVPPLSVSFSVPAGHHYKYLLSPTRYFRSSVAAKTMERSAVPSAPKTPEPNIFFGCVGAVPILLLLLLLLRRRQRRHKAQRLAL